MYFNAPRLQQRVPIKKTPLASSRLRRSIGKFQFLLAKANPMPDVCVYVRMGVSIYGHDYDYEIDLFGHIIEK